MEQKGLEPLHSQSFPRARYLTYANCPRWGTLGNRADLTVVPFPHRGHKQFPACAISVQVYTALRNGKNRTGV